MTKYFLRDTPLEEYERLMMELPHPMRQTRVTVTLEPLPQTAQFYDCRGCLAFQRKRCTARHCAWIKERLENQHRRRPSPSRPLAAGGASSAGNRGTAHIHPL